MIHDLIIIGAGPAGLAAGIYSGSRKMKTIILDAASAGGQLKSLYPDKGIHNYPGFAEIQAKKLSERLVAHAMSMGCEIIESCHVKEIKEGDGFFIVRGDEHEYHGRTVIVAIGMGLFKPRKLGIPGEEEFYGKGVDYVLPEKDRLVDKRMVMIGGGNSALEMALIADSVTHTTLVHRRNTFRADESVVEALTNSGVNCLLETNTISINGNEKVESVTLECKGKRFDIPADMVIINIGINPDLEDLKRWDLDLNEGGLLIVDSEMRTSRPGVFACGDVVFYSGKCRRIATACGEAAPAANSAYKFIKKPYWA
ncbi:MAG TPA: NAD(P)/FAD-dependent oxidoreductase [Candidatus Methanomethylophilaceae archaeon]|nr:NAD(P)/FAD-dependent oxidoreductase [Candidatus Methanomethylophilaceae archaeon]